MHPELERRVCAGFEQAVGYEWLVTNGIGGFACGTVADVLSRCYHGLLIAALRPPTDRVMLVSKLDITASYLGRRFALFSNEFADDGAIAGNGLLYLESFRLDRGLPVWRYAIADALIEKRVVMQPGSNTTLVTLEVLRASSNIELNLAPLCSYRDYHSLDYGNWVPAVNDVEGGFEVLAFSDASGYRVICDHGEFRRDFVWYRNFKYRQETERGLPDKGDLFRPGAFHVTLGTAEKATVTLTDEVFVPDGYDQVMRQLADNRRSWLKSLPETVPDWIEQLAAAAGQFIVDRWDDGGLAGKTVIAGYPWFADWGRDTMIALPGLTLALGHFGVAADILRAYAGYVDSGMVPNRFSERGGSPEYNTADAALWFIHAVDQYTRYSGDRSLSRELFPVLAEIVDRYRHGTRFGIRVDHKDGLLMAGETGLQVTWMDAKVDDWVVTPRIGKCVELNALWYNALKIMEETAAGADRSDLAEKYREGALQVKYGFRHFWNENRCCLYDVIHGEEGELGDDGRRYDGRLRPNQLLAVSLPHSPLDDRRQKAVLDLCTRELLTSYGLRSLADSEPGYQPVYQGERRQRDGAYHQGTVWAWLIGPFVDAHFRVYENAESALSFLEPFRLHLNEACLGQIGEIFDASPPFVARGCFAQAWSVAEILRVWLKYGSPIDRTSPRKISPPH